MSFFKSRTIKATRKEHLCESCQSTIPAGSPAYYGSMLTEDGDLFAWHAHSECRAAEVAWNCEADQFGEDFCWLWQIHEDDETKRWLVWLAQHHPIACARLAGIAG